MLPLHKPLAVSTFIHILTKSTYDPILGPAGPESSATARGPSTLTGYVSTTPAGYTSTTFPTGYASTTSGATTTVISGGNTGGETQKYRSTNVGAIAGSVVGGVLGLALIALLGIFLLRHHNSRRVAPSSLIDPSQDHGLTPTVAGSRM